MTTILLVEDDPVIAEGIDYALAQEGFAVLHADKVQTAKGMMDEGGFQLAILDIALPDGSGLELCRYLRAKGSIPVIFLTARDEESSIILGLDMGADDYITKPFRVRELISRIRAVIRRHTNEADSRYLLSGDIRVDLSSGKVSLGSTEVILTRQEYKLLLLFLQNPGQILERNTLLARLWDVDENYIDDNTLTVYIRRLREKLEQDASVPQYILTSRGLGYRWGVPVQKTN